LRVERIKLLIETRLAVVSGPRNRLASGTDVL
jgi:hypothetical protein